ncbi:hypothetical protein DPMN_123886 [Dreissena polymorpha]|uniref:Uncharacterized protein n=1 Tax=Dreissena polymorpha TaxID=45954 RepID=A0A9D4GS71_DREPO|nr:hypothetical protein DPMN_123886 [Dreissena polymorpha]
MLKQHRQKSGYFCGRQRDMKCADSGMVAPCKTAQCAAWSEATLAAYDMRLPGSYF